MLGFITGGCNAKHPPAFSMSRPKGLSHYLLLLVKSRARFRIDGKDLIIEPNTALFIHKNIPYQYQSIRGNYMNDWMHFECSDDTLIKSMGIPFQHPIPLGDPSKYTLYIQQIIWENSYTSSRYKAENVNMLLRVLINNLLLTYDEMGDSRTYHPYYARLQSLRLRIQAEPYRSFSPEEITEAAGISYSYFQHLYTEFFGLPFRTDHINARVEYARNMLVTTDMKLEQIAEICGYSNEIHFYRQFRLKTGLTPTEYRIRETSVNGTKHS